MMQKFASRIVVRAVLILIITKLFIIIYEWLTDVESESEDYKFFVTVPLPLPVEFSRQDAKVDASTNHNDGFSLQPLLDELGDRWQFSWIKQRMEIMWPEINLAGRYVTNMSCDQWTGRPLRIMFLPGLLTKTDFARHSRILRGGPLGELIQWSDLIAACYALCHSIAPRVRIISTASELLSEVDEKRATAPTGCDDNDFVEVIFTDLIAAKALSPAVHQAYKYKLRVLDAFGTEAIYNDNQYVESHPELKYKAGWARLGLRLKQFYTLYPHTPDNSFLGFIIPQAKLINVTKKENYALIIGKEPQYLLGKEKVLKTVLKYMEVKATMRNYDIPGLSPGDITFLGVISSEEFRSVIVNAKVCIGLGDPLESPSAIEALACSCIFLNPRQKGEHGGFRGKPTSRRITSQVPYFEEFVGPPHTYTVDYDDVNALHAVLDNITSSNHVVQPFIPHEFTAVGFVERLHSYLTHQRFCPHGEVSSWPPASGLVVRLSTSNVSCKHTCHAAGLVCEPDYFRLLNNMSFIEKMVGATCSIVKHVAEPFAPVLMTSATHLGAAAAAAECWLQLRHELFSCAESANGIRICPCRPYKRHQIALLP